jgi:hypothetical protein
MENFIKALLKDEMAADRSEAIETINCMKEEVEGGEDIQDVLSQYDLDLDLAIDLLGI